MKLNTDSTARIIVLSLCVSIVIMRLIRPEIPFDGASLGALALAALIAIAPVFSTSRKASTSPAPTPADVNALRQKFDKAGLLLGESSGAYMSLEDMQPQTLALAGTRATLDMRLKMLADKSKVNVHGAGVKNYLDALSTAGITTPDQYDALGGLINMLDRCTQEDCPAGTPLLELAIRVIEMLDATIA